MAGLIYKSAGIHYTSQGKGNTVVLLHGFLENTSMWDHITPHLTKKNRVICIDLLGHGKSGNLGYVHGMEEQANMVKYVLDQLKLKKYKIIGHSMGGYIALAFAELYPHYVEGLCLMNSTATADDTEKRINRDRAIKAVKHSPKTFVKLAIPNLFSEENKTRLINAIKLITNEALQMSQQGIIAALEGMKIRKDRTSILKSKYFPVFMIISKQDPALDYNCQMEQTKNANVSFVEFPDGHMSHMENTNDLVIALLNFTQ